MTSPRLSGILSCTELAPIAPIPKHLSVSSFAVFHLNARYQLDHCVFLSLRTAGGDLRLIVRVYSCGSEHVYISASRPSPVHK